MFSKLMEVDKQYFSDYTKGKIAILKELIALFKSRDPLEEYTTNVILLELNVRLRELEEK